MSLIALIYWADVVNVLGILLFFFGMIGMLFGFIISSENASRGEEIGRGRLIAIAGLLSVLLSAFLPSKKTLYAMAAIKFGEQVIETPQAQELGNKVFKLLNQKLDEALPKENDKGNDE